MEQRTKPGDRRSAPWRWTTRNNYLNFFACEIFRMRNFLVCIDHRAALSCDLTDFGMGNHVPKKSIDGAIEIAKESNLAWESQEAERKKKETSV